MRRGKVFLVYAMKRSGHHHVIDQMCQMLAPVVHFNNCRVRHDRIDVPHHRFRAYHGRWVFDNERRSRTSFRLHRWLLDWHTKTAVYSFEDADLERPSPAPLVSAEDIVEVLIVRDPYNWLASSLEAGGNKTSDLPRRIALQKQHLRYALGRAGTEAGRAIIPLGFNAWLTDRSYRVRKCGELGIPYRDDTDRGVVPSMGGGSSFDGTRRDGRGQTMKVLQRYEAFVDDPVYDELIDSELAALSDAFFGPVVDAAPGGRSESEPEG